jgi:hypothetical protein
MSFSLCLIKASRPKYWLRARRLTLGRRAHPGPQPPRPGLRHLHLRLDREAKMGSCQSRQCGQLHGLGFGGLSAQRRFRCTHQTLPWPLMRPLPAFFSRFCRASPSRSYWNRDSLKSWLGNPIVQSAFSLLKLNPGHIEALNQLLPSESLAGFTHCLNIGGESLNELSLGRWRRMHRKHGSSTSMDRLRRLSVARFTKCSRAILRVGVFRSAGRSGTRRCMYWMGAFGLCRWALMGSFTLPGRGRRGVVSTGQL